jgi:hypothetical protein
MSLRPARLATALALAGLLVMPNIVMRDCVAMHGSMARMMGPNGMMVAGMAGMVEQVQP